MSCCCCFCCFFYLSFFMFKSNFFGNRAGRNLDGWNFSAAGLPPPPPAILSGAYDSCFMDIHKDLALWVLDFVLRRPLREQTLNVLLSILPIPAEDLHLQKLLLLWKLDSEVSTGGTSESLLEWLERLEEVEFCGGNEASAAMKLAYCMTAVDCTLRVLTSGEVGDDMRRLRLYETAKKVWVGRIARMKRVPGGGGLGSDLLWKWDKDIKAAALDDEAFESILQRFEGVRAIEAIREYLRSERERMGASILELVAEGEIDSVKRLQRNTVRAREVLKTSLMELRAAVDAPIPNPQAFQLLAAIIKLQKAVGCISDIEIENEWDDPIGGSSEDMARTPLPKKIKTSSSKVHESSEMKRKWSLEEEEALVEGVEKFGIGSWKKIRLDNLQVFEHRTEVNMKDKWRNLTK